MTCDYSHTVVEASVELLGGRLTFFYGKFTLRIRFDRRARHIVLFYNSLKLKYLEDLTSTI